MSILTNEREMNMKLDIASLKELSDVELEAVYGGQLGVGASGSLAANARIHSFAGFCDINIFSNNVVSSVLKGVLNIANCNTQICANND